MITNMNNVLNYEFGTGMRISKTKISQKNNTLHLITQPNAHIPQHRFLFSNYAISYGDIT